MKPYIYQISAVPNPSPNTIATTTTTFHNQLAATINCGVIHNTNNDPQSTKSSDSSRISSILFPVCHPTAPPHPAGTPYTYSGLDPRMVGHISGDWRHSVI